LLPDQRLMPGKKTVLVYRNELLPISETFIKEQVLALTDWRAVLVGRKKLDQLPLDDLNIRLIGPSSPAFHHRLLWKAHRILGTVPPHVKRLLEAEQPLLIHAHFGVDAIDAWPLARALRLPMLVTLHGYDINIHRTWWEAGNAGCQMRFYPRRLLRLAHEANVTFIAVSRALRERAIKFGIPAEKLRVSYIGINTAKFAPGKMPIEQRPLQVLFVGRLVEKKGCQYLIEAIAAVQKELPTASLVVIGDGPLRRDLEQTAAKCGASVLFRGAQTSADVKRELDASRILCLPSVTAENGDAESFGLVLLEAQASGVPVVSSALGGATEGIREGVTGYSFAERDIGELARILTSFLRRGKQSQMAGEARQYVSTQFDLKRCTGLLEILYDEHAARSNAEGI
jgi:glucosyltransferase